uniref:Glycoside hydrolase family 28 n=1 Tax=Extatosoma tiaratum TaxID=7024 RepID=A0A191XSZ8_EXTTI|nr:glycoside hydrolase family 28 [Extatosoma tiaratum]
MQQQLVFLVAIALLALVHVGTARDLRKVVEPKNPPTCTSLKATGGDDTKAIQKALDSCAKGKAVTLAAGVFYSGPLTIPSGVSLLLDTGVALRAIPKPALYDKGRRTCGTIDDSGDGCKSFITIKGAKGSGIYGTGTIDGEGGARINARNLTWFKLNKVASGRGRKTNSPMLIEISNSEDITLYKITLVRSPFYHVYTSETNGLTVWGITINSPTASVSSDGIFSAGSQNVTVSRCRINTKDDNIGISALTAPSRYISVYETHFGRGNGLAIGSRIIHGVSNVTFSNMTLNALSSGMRIKTNTLNGGVVANIVYENICVYRARFPIFLDMYYHGLTGDRKPEFKNIAFKNIQVGSAGQFIFRGVNENDPIKATINDMRITLNSTWSIANTQFSGNWVTNIGKAFSCKHFKF